jgi:hypothetical protein
MLLFEFQKVILRRCSVAAGAIQIKSINETDITAKTDDYMANFESLMFFAESYKNIRVDGVQIMKDIIVRPVIYTYEPQTNAIISEIRPQIFARFDEDMDEQTINEQSMRVVEDQTKIRLSGMVIWNPKIRAVIFELTKDLHNSKRYDVIISKQVKDKSGTQLKEDFSWSFFTR